MPARSLPGLFRCSIERGRSWSCAGGGQQAVEPARPFQRHEVVAAADMRVADEDLRHGRAAVRALDHRLPLLPAEIDGNLLILDSLAVEQVLGSPAIRTEGLGID